jgi:hypothetical protein
MSLYWDIQDCAFQEALRGLVDQPLTSVEYEILTSDMPYFEAAVPNETGLMGVNVTLGTSSVQLEVRWGLTERTYHTLVLLQPARKDAAGLTSTVAADGAPLWRSAVGQPILAVEAYSSERATLAISLSFPSVHIAICTGYGGTDPSDPVVGDGDELLAFEIHEWERARRITPGSLWASYRVAREQ